MPALQTPRLTLRELSPGDAEFILRLLNEPSFIRHIGDRGVRNESDARRYIVEGPMESYARHGFGLYLVELKESGTPAGICGLLKRDSLDGVDVGFALLPQFWSRGYAFEAASAVVADARNRGITRVLAVVSPDNAPSIGLLGKLGFRFERTTRLPGESSDIKLFARETARSEETQ